MPFDATDPGTFGHSAGVPAPPPRPTLQALRHAVARIEGVPVERLEDTRASARRERRQLPFGVTEVDAALRGGLPGSGLTELRAGETRDAGAASGLALAFAVLLAATPRRPLLWIGERLVNHEAGIFHRLGLAAFGLDPAALVLVETRRLSEAVWAGEEAARSGTPALVVLEIRGNPKLLGMEGTRRLHLRGRTSGVPIFLLRQSGVAEPTAAPIRLSVEPAPSSRSRTLRLIGPPVFRITLEKTPEGRHLRFDLEWNTHEHRFLARSDTLPGALPAAPAERSYPARAPRALVALGRAS